MTVWNLKASKAGEAIRVPVIPPGPDRTNARLVFLSPDAKLMAVGRTARPDAPAPFRVIDLATGKELVSFDWTGGVVHFTPDSSRVLVSETSGRCRWFKLPSGEADGGWELPKRVGIGLLPSISSISNDGRVLGYYGPPNGDAAAVAILDGKTGNVLRAFGRDYIAGRPSVSGDGRLAAVLRRDEIRSYSVEVLEIDSGHVIAKAVIDSGGMVPTYFLTPDGKALIVRDPSNEKVHWFDLPQQAPPPPKPRVPVLPPAPNPNRPGIG